MNNRSKWILSYRNDDNTIAIDLNFSDLYLNLINEVYLICKESDIPNKDMVNILETIDRLLVTEEIKKLWN